MSRRSTQSTKRGRGLALLAGLGLALSTLAPPSAAAAINPLASGQTTIHLAPSFTKLLKQNKVALKALAPARLKGQTLSLPVKSGRIDSDSGQGAIGHSGALKITSPRGSLTIREFTLRTTTEPLIANTNGPTMKLAAGQGLSLPREGFGQGVRYRTLKLSASFAKRLDKRLHLGGAFAPGQLLGSLLSKTQPASVAIAAQGTLSLTPDPQTLAKLDALHVAVNPIFPTEHIGGVFYFPIILNGRLAPNLSSGTLRVGGSLEFLYLNSGESRYAKLILNEPWLSFDGLTTSSELNVSPSPPYQGRSERPTLFAIGMSGASASNDPAARTITLSGTSLAMGAQLAAAYDEAFAGGKEEFKAGDLLGTFGFTARAQ